MGVFWFFTASAFSGLFRLGLCIDSGMWVCDLFVFWLPKTSLVCKFSCLLKLPPTSFFCLSAPSVYGDKFVNQHHHLNLNIIISSLFCIYLFDKECFISFSYRYINHSYLFPFFFWRYISLICMISLSSRFKYFKFSFILQVWDVYVIESIFLFICLPLDVHHILKASLFK